MVSYEWLRSSNGYVKHINVLEIYLWQLSGTKYVMHHNFDISSVEDHGPIVSPVVNNVGVYNKTQEYDNLQSIFCKI